jgi:hypothetical protein
MRTWCVRTCGVSSLNSALSSWLIASTWVRNVCAAGDAQTCAWRTRSRIGGWNGVCLFACCPVGAALTRESSGATSAALQAHSQGRNGATLQRCHATLRESAPRPLPRTRCAPSAASR